MKITAIALTVATIIGLTAPATAHDHMHREEPSTATSAAIGGHFALTDENGAPFTDKDLLGKYALVYFGFTSCPDVCPVDLRKIGDVLNMLDEKRLANLQTVFITVDPENDTPKAMKDYTDLFHKNIIGLTGSEADLKAVRNGYKVYAAKGEKKADGGHMMNHSAYIYLMDPKGEFVDIFDPSEDAKKITEQVKGFIKP